MGEEHLRLQMKAFSVSDVMVAFSGGVDSALILKLACQAAKYSEKKVYAVMLHTMLHPAKEMKQAKKLAEEFGAIFEVIKVDELKQAGIMDNPQNRCYLCKHYLFSKLRTRAKELGIRHILDGTNEDDLHLLRPGLKALEELDIISPLALAHITKKQVRQLAKEQGISIANKPSTPCLATRFPYGTTLSYEAMEKVEKAEEYIKSLGFYNVRVRVYDLMARIEIDQEEMMKMLTSRETIVKMLKELGYHYVTLDLEGFRSGSMDEINIEGRK